MEQIILCATPTEFVLESLGTATTEPCATATEAVHPRICVPQREKLLH